MGRYRSEGGLKMSKNKKAKKNKVPTLQELGDQLSDLRKNTLQEYTLQELQQEKKQTVAEFLLLQSRVFQKIGYYPKTWILLDQYLREHSAYDLIALLEAQLKPKPTLTPPKPTEISKETKNYFADLEKTLEKEDKQKGKDTPPPDYEDKHSTYADKHSFADFW